MKTAFFIAPIGKDGSEERKLADNVQKFFLGEAIAKDFDIVRADKIDIPGSITEQIITLLVHADLVVADITGRNPNVLYELGIRHAVNKPTITLCSVRDTLPFDIADQRTIFYDISDISTHQVIVKKIAQAAMLADSYISPVAYAKLSENTKQSEIIDAINEINGKLDTIESDIWVNSFDTDLDSAKDEILEAVGNAKNYMAQVDDMIWEFKRELRDFLEKIAKK